MSQIRFNSYDFLVPFAALAENLVNSYDGTHEPPDYLRTTQDLRDLLVQHDLPAQRVTSADLEGARSVRDEVRRVFEARTQGEAVAEINSLLDRARVRIQVVKRKAGVALDWRVDEGGVADQLRSAAALNLAFLVETVGLERLRVCVASPCRDVFVDVSKNGARRFCGAGCANRTRVAQFRERRRAER